MKHKFISLVTRIGQLTPPWVNRCWSSHVVFIQLCSDNLCILYVGYFYKDLRIFTLTSHWILLRMMRGGADKSLARHTSQCHRTESIVSLERGSCSCAELQVFSCYRGWKEECQVTCAISTTSRRGLSSIFFPARQGAEGNSRHSDRNIRGTCTMVCHRQKRGGAVQTWWFFHLWCASSWTTQNSDHPGDWLYSRANLGRPPDFG